MTQLFKNNAFSSLAADLSDTSTLATLAVGTGARFPAPTGVDFFLATMVMLDGNGAETAWEIVKCTSRATDGLTIIRAQEGTTARSWSAGTHIELRITAGSLSPITTSVQKTSDTGSALMPVGTTAERDASPVYGAERTNSTLNSKEWWNGTSWVPIGGGQLLVSQNGEYGYLEKNGAEVVRFGGAAGDNSGQLAGFRNLIINGDMRVSQRGTSVVASAGVTTYTLDRWLVGAIGAAVTASAGDEVSTGGPTYMAITGAAGNTNVSIRQRIESLNVRGVAGKKVTVSLKLYNASGNASSALLHLAYPTVKDTFTSMSYSTGQSINLATQATQSFTFDVPTDAEKGIELFINVASLTSGVMVLRDVQLEVGSIATPFERRPIGLELALCRRYFRSDAVGCIGAVTSGYAIGGVMTFDSPMRAIPTITFNGSLLASSFPTTSPSFDTLTTNGYRHYKTATATSPAGSYVDSVNSSSEL